MRVMVVDAVVQRRRDVETSLRANGHEVIAIGSVPDLAAAVERYQPDVILIDVDAPSRDTLESLSQVTRRRPRPMVLFAGDSRPDLIRRAMNAGVTSYVVGGLELNRIQPILDVAMARFEQYQHLKQELQTVKTQLADDQAIAKAKGIMMRNRGVTDAVAHERLIALAKERRLSLGDAARILIDASKFL